MSRKDPVYKTHNIKYDACGSLYYEQNVRFHNIAKPLEEMRLCTFTDAFISMPMCSRLNLHNYANIFLLQAPGDL